MLRRYNYIINCGNSGNKKRERQSFREELWEKLWGKCVIYT